MHKFRALNQQDYDDWIDKLNEIVYNITRSQTQNFETNTMELSNGTISNESENDFVSAFSRSTYHVKGRPEIG